ncbi:efflux RND transporter periplasmic adaptor subunit [Labrys sp. KB_33_2]|uniref:efflux RND transporter periplasmic adaptor subunit n=1 Tax=Labrys sp. KB_33_2 TaxID=3237479 RepID=UPI003F8DCD77
MIHPRIASKPKAMIKISRLCLLLLALALLFVWTAGGTSMAEGTDAAETKAALVSVSQATSETVTLFDELPGRVSAFRTADIRPQVGGIVERRLFEQGSEVVQGQALYQIAAAPFQADVDMAAAALLRAEAMLERARKAHERAERLVKVKAISADSFDQAVSSLAQTQAGVAEAKATLQRRKLDLAFTTVRAPIGGQTGRSLVSEGALVSANDANALTTIQQIDRVFVDILQPAASIEAVRQAARDGLLDDASKLPVDLFATDGRRYPVSGRALFSDISVDPGTGNLMVRVEVDNPARALLPGMYVRARLPRGIRKDVLLVPEQAVARDAAGQPQLVVLTEGKPERRAIRLGDAVGGRVIVASGLRAGEIYVVQGQERAQDGEAVRTVPFEDEALAAKPSQPLLR